MANSRVGESTNIAIPVLLLDDLLLLLLCVVCGGPGTRPNLSAFSKAGKMKASVFPVPVRALPRIS